MGDSPVLGVEDCSALGDLPGLVVEDCSALGDSPGEQIPFGLAQEHWPTHHFGQLRQLLAQLLQYSTGTEVVR